MNITDLTPEECMTIWNGLMELPSKQTFSLLNQKIVPQYMAQGLITQNPAPTKEDNGLKPQPEVKLDPPKASSEG